MTTATPSKTRMIQFGPQQVELNGKYLGNNLIDSTPLLRANDFPALRQSMKDNGYLLIRGFHSRETVMAARKRVFEFMQEGGAVKAGTDPEEAIPAEPEKHVGLFGKSGVAQSPEVLAVIESTKLLDFYSEYFGTKSMTYDYKWMRAVKAPGYTGSHMDIVYMGRGTTEKLITCWTPFGDIPIELGTLGILVGSHNLPSWQKVRDTYGKKDVDRDRVEGWFCNDPIELMDKYGGKWETTDFRAGDILMFGMWTIHSSTSNTTDRFRLSTDTRYQPANEPVDERWIGETPKAHYQWYSEPTKMVKMADKKKEWGV